MAARKIDGRWYADFRFQHADGSIERVRKRSPVQSKAGADEFEHQLRTALLAPTHTTKEVPTFAAYADEFKKTYVLANNKPSERSMKASILKHHLLPVFGEMQLDAIKMHAIEILKADLLAKGLSRKRVNNILACLGKMLRYAHEIELIEVVPRVKLLKVPQQRFDFLTFEELSRLVEAMQGDPERLALVLLGAEAGLRQGETMALEWGDVDLVAGLLTVRRSSWKGLIGTPKSGKERKVPLTGRLRAALKAIKHLKSELVLCHQDGKPLTQSAIEAALRFGCKRAGLRTIGSHVLRHTFCSHLAMRGAAPKAIQELVGHSTLTMTLRYMHLAPSALTEAIGLLNFGQPVGSAVPNGADGSAATGRDALRCSLPSAAPLLGTLRADPFGTAACCESLGDVGQTVRTLRRCSLLSVVIDRRAVKVRITPRSCETARHLSGV